MKRYSRLTTALLLAVMMLFTLAPAVSYAEVNDENGSDVMLISSDGGAGLENFLGQYTYTSGKFEDVLKSAWYYDSVKTAYELGLVKGMSSTSFSPDGNITIAESIALAARIHNIYNGGNGDFIQGEPWYMVYADYARDNGIIRYGQFTDYNKTATRSQFAAILAGALPSKELVEINQVDSLPDVASTDKYADSIYLLYRAGVLTGNDAKGTFLPNSSIKRSEVSAIITRMVDTGLRKNFELESMSVTGYIGKSLSEVIDGMGSGYTYKDYYGALGVNYEDQGVLFFGENSYFGVDLSDKVFSMLVYSGMQIIDDFKGNMTYNELKSALGPAAEEIYLSEEGVEEEGYSAVLSFKYKGYYFAYTWEMGSNPYVHGADFVLINSAE